MLRRRQIAPCRSHTKPDPTPKRQRREQHPPACKAEASRSLLGLQPHERGPDIALKETASPPLPAPLRYSESPARRIATQPTSLNAQDQPCRPRKPVAPLVQQTLRSKPCSQSRHRRAPACGVSRACSP